MREDGERGGEEGEGRGWGHWIIGSEIIFLEDYQLRTLDPPLVTELTLLNEFPKKT